MLSRPPQPPGDIKLGPPPLQDRSDREPAPQPPPLQHLRWALPSQNSLLGSCKCLYAPKAGSSSSASSRRASSTGLAPTSAPQGGSAAPCHPPTPKERIPRHRLPQNGARRAERRDTGLVLHPATATSPRSGCFPHRLLAPGAQAPGSLLTSVPQFPPGEQQEGFQHQPAWQRNPKPGAKHFGG